MTTFNEETLLKLIAPHLGASATRPAFTPILTGKHNRSYWVNWDSDRFVLRISPPDDAGFLFYERLMMRQEPGLHKLIRERTTIPVAEVIGYDFSREIIDRDYLLMRALPGTPLSETQNPSPGLFSCALEQVGDYLRQLHTLTAHDCLNITAFGYLGEHHPMNPQPTWAAAFKVMWNMLLDDVVACGTYTPVEAQIIRDLFEYYKDHFNRPVAPRLLHMDVWSQNILLDDQGNVTGLVDFDRALWGDIEIEFAVLDYCGISEPPFWVGYGSERDTSPSARIRQQFYLLYELQKYMPIRVWRRNDPTAAERYKEQSLTMIRQLIAEA
jgi:aminoglycoside phosphotransferase (APT) family kinase protein